MAKSLAAVMEASPRKPGDVLANQVQRHRVRRGWTQRELCQKIEERFGAVIDPATLARLENGKRRVSVDEACLLAVALDVPLCVLMWPIHESEVVSVAPGVEVAPWVALEWAAGNDPLPGADEEAWDASTTLLVGFGTLLNAAYEADFYRVEVERGRHEDEYRAVLSKLARMLAKAESIGLPTEGMIPPEVLVDLEKFIAEATVRKERMTRPRRGGES